MTQAIFLSYARDDAVAARRIAEALRSAGLEVWFDEDELRGGDAWDEKIRRQIDACALFIPVVSRCTTERVKGYFRLEWKLAVDQTQMLAPGVPFIAPVVIDDTRENESTVPPEFLRVQWIRLPGALPTPDFVAQIKRLLDAPRSGSVAPSAPRTAGRATAPAAGRGPALIGAGVVVAALVIGGVLWRRPSSPLAEPAPAPPAATKPAASAPAEPQLDDKSIAVLPFVDMSQAKDQEYFSDGIAEELLNLLAKVPQLRVAARTSAFSFKGKNAEIPEIAQRLHVAHVLEGSVRKSGNTLRITAQLVRATDGYHLWSNTWDRNLDDIFKVQDEIAAAVVSQLKITLLGAPPTARPVDPKAYPLLLQAKFFVDQSSADGWTQAIRLYQQALEIAPGEARAWAGLGRVYLNQTTQGFRPYAEGEKLARDMSNKALELDPENASALCQLGWLDANFTGDNAAAAQHLARAFALDPANFSVVNSVATLLELLGRMDESLVLYKYLTARDPANPVYFENMTLVAYNAGRWDDSLAAGRIALSLSPKYIGAHAAIGTVLLVGKGDAAGALKEFEAESDDLFRLTSLPLAYDALGRQAEAEAILATIMVKYEKDAAVGIATVFANRGDADRAFAWLAKAIEYRDPALATLPLEPLFAKIHSDPRWMPLLRKLGKAPEQLAAVKFDLALPK